MHVNGTDLNVEQTGQGQPVLMLHGLSSNIAALAPERERLGRRFRVVAIDSRGHGRSARPAAYTLQDHVNDVLGVMDALGLERADVIGSSMGSYIAQGVAASAPDRVRRLVLITPKASGQTSSVARFLAEHADAVRDLTPSQVQAYVANGIFAPETPQTVRDALAARTAEHAAAGLTLTPEQDLAAQRALEGFDFRPVLPRVTAPTLVISGRHDPLNPVRDGEEVARLIPNARLEVLEHAGHLPSLEEPDRLWTLVEAFLNG